MEYLATTNGHSTGSGIMRPLSEGVYVPTLAFFIPDTEAIDLDTTRKHVTRLSGAGVSGIVTHGSNGEAAHLTRDERVAITRATREALDDCGRRHLPIIVGCGAQSTRETINLCEDAARSGGDYALVLPPSYYRSIVSREQLVDHFVDVAEGSPIPILIYNFPAAAGGVNLDSDVILELAAHPNIVGCKLTCGDTGKLARIVTNARDSEDLVSNRHRNGVPGGFLVLSGSADFLLQTLVVGGSGTIAGLANIGPRTCVRVVQLYRKFERDGDMAALREAQKLQGILATADWVAIKGGFPTVKDALTLFCGYGGSPRRPCAQPSKDQRSTIESGLRALMNSEASI